MKTHAVSRRFTATALTLSLVAMQAPRAQAAPHVVGPEQIAQRLLAAAETREARVRLFGDALAAEGAQKQARAMGLDPARLRAAVPHLSDQELLDPPVPPLQVMVLPLSLQPSHLHLLSTLPSHGNMHPCLKIS